MRRAVLVGITVVVIAVVFFFVPVVQMSTANFGGGPNHEALASLSFAILQCGAYVGQPGILVPNGGIANGVAALWERTSNWNCQFPNLN